MLELENVCRSTLETNRNSDSNWPVCLVACRRWKGTCMGGNRYTGWTIKLITKSGEAQ